MSVTPDLPVSAAHLRTRSIKARPTPAPLVIRFDRDLFDMSLAIHDIDNDVADMTVSLVDSHPADDR
jgi:hypothetical protein